MAIGDVLEGNKPIKFEVSVDYTSAAIIGGIIFVSIVAAYFFLKGISKVAQ